MPRRRYISTDISIDARINALAKTHGDFAVLLYTWLIPHAKDDTSFPADPEEVLMLVIPGRRDKSVEDVENALRGMAEKGLIEWNEGATVASFPPDTFYRYQTYIRSQNRRDETIPLNTDKRRETPQTAVSFPHSHSPSPSFTPSHTPSPTPSPSKREGVAAHIGLTSFDVWLRNGLNTKNDGQRIGVLMDMAALFWEPKLEDGAGGRAAAVVKATRGDFGYAIKLMWDTMSERPSGDPFTWILGKVKKTKPKKKPATDYLSGKFGHLVKTSLDYPKTKVNKKTGEVIDGNL